MAGQRSNGHAGRAGPTIPSPKPSGLSSVLERNIQALHGRRQQEEARAGVQERIADAITRFTGSMTFVYLHLAIFGFWIVANLGWVPGVPQWDPTFVVLAMWASVEAIFLSTFVLISQNRMAAVAERLDVRTEVDPELAEIQQDVAPEEVLDAIENTEANRKLN